MAHPFDNQGQLPPEHYLARAKSLDISRLQQKRYSTSTQETLERLGCTFSTLVLTQRSTGNRSEILTRRSDYYMHSSAGGAIFGVARTFVTVQECLKELVLSPSRSVVASCSNAGDGLWIEKNIAVKVIVMVAELKDLEVDRKPKNNVYIEDVAEFASASLHEYRMMGL
ncbi:hypothetical protein AnigIFM49718_000841 [Aspergillus niger]|nr:hypothetical protein AnigIFM49718_000841 [Aspergillus niger]GLA21745.1 hypothetical protein AnigIFM62618_000971 [Aspergillus niger]